MPKKCVLKKNLQTSWFWYLVVSHRLAKAPRVRIYIHLKKKYIYIYICICMYVDCIFGRP